MRIGLRLMVLAFALMGIAADAAGVSFNGPLPGVPPQPPAAVSAR